MDKLIIAGLVKNAEKTFSLEYQKLNKLFEDDFEIHWIIVESESTDSTINVLKEIKNQNNCFDYLTFGSHQYKELSRTEKFSFLRNQYVEYIKKSNVNFDYVVISDFDRVNKKLTKKGIQSCWQTNYEWDACFANQNGPYYDIYALRHNLLSPHDFSEEFNFKLKVTKDRNWSEQSSLFSKMLKINQESDWIEVDSAFGGFGIYRKRAFLSSSYKGKDDSDKRVCEHVTFHKNMVDQGFKLFINPRLINANYVDHSFRYLKIYRKFHYFKNKFLSFN